MLKYNMTKIEWHPISDFYIWKGKKCLHRKDPPHKWLRLPCVYKISIQNKIIHIGRSDTCKKHGGAEKVRKAIVNLLNLTLDNPSVPKTKYWKEIRLKYQPNSSNIKIGIIKTNAIAKTYTQETKRIRQI